MFRFGGGRLSGAVHCKGCFCWVSLSFAPEAFVPPWQDLLQQDVEAVYSPQTPFLLLFCILYDCGGAELGPVLHKQT